MLNIFSDIANTDPPALPANPYGFFRNDTVPTDGTGTPLIFNWVQDLYYSNYSLLDSAGVVPSSAIENSSTSDVLTAVNKLRNGNVSPTVITTTTVLDETYLNKTLQIDLTLGDIDLTLPNQNLWSLSDSLKFYIVDCNTLESNRLRIIGDAGQLISSFNSHDFYYLNSWVNVKKFTSGLFVDDYYDSKSLIWNCYFDDVQEQLGISAFSTPLVYPTIVQNQGSFYNIANGEATVKIPGDWQILAKAGKEQNVSDVLHIAIFLNSSPFPNADNQNQISNVKPYCEVSTIYSTSVTTDILTVVIKGTTTVRGDVNLPNNLMLPGFSGTLLKRAV